MLKKLFGKKRKNETDDCASNACRPDDPLLGAFRGAGASEGAGGCCDPYD